MKNQVNLLACMLVMVFTLVSCNDDGPTDPVNTAPEITGLAATPATVETGATASLTCTAADSDGDALAYAWSSTEGTITGVGATVVWTAPATAGSYAVTCEVSDASDSASETIDVVVFEVPVPGAMTTVQGGTFAMGIPTMKAPPKSGPSTT